MKFIRKIISIALLLCLGFGAGVLYRDIKTLKNVQWPTRQEIQTFLQEQLHDLQVFIEQQQK